MEQLIKENIEEILLKWEDADGIEKDYVIRNTQKYLKDTDYVVIKIQEYTLLNKPIENDYTEIFEKREQARNILRELEVTN